MIEQQKERSYLLRQHEGEDRVWRATWATPSGRHIEVSLDMGATERIKRLDAAGLRKPKTPTEELMHAPSPWDVRWLPPDPRADLRNGFRLWPAWIRLWAIIIIGIPR